MKKDHSSTTTLHGRRSAALLGFLALCAVVCTPGISPGQDSAATVKALRSIADRIVRDSVFQFIDQKTGHRFETADAAPSTAVLKLVSPHTDWRYWNGVLNIALLRMGNVLQSNAYLDFPSKNIAFSFDNYKHFEALYHGEGKWSYPFGGRFLMEELDDCGAMGASVIEVYHLSQQPRYRTYIDQVATHILSRQARLGDGTLARAFPHKWTLWADDLYMSIAFLSRMGELTGEQRYFDDAAKQVLQFNKYLFDSTTGLMYHCWYSDLQQHGVAFWGRANGWALLAQVDLLDRLPDNHPLRSQLLQILQRHLLGIARYQGPTGLWHQLLDKPDSYPETSCSAMFTYAFARAVNRGYIDKRYASVAQRGWAGVMTAIQPDGQVTGVCAGTSVSDNLVDYYNRPAPVNDVHGLGALLLAGTEILQLRRSM
ncbi:MAG TPA: glycoside hydrolase family 88 protein [Bacteroidota bacterium]|nr:glycoside hydrolase family 88 protein [Bacteroidota bacterium]